MAISSAIGSLGRRDIAIDLYDDPHAAAAAGWDALAAAAVAPVFYRPAYLTAYHDAPLAPLDRVAYLVVRAGGEPVAALPVALHPAADPLGGLRGAHPGIEDGPALLSHVWHCYDTRIVGATDRPVVDAILGTLAELARAWGAPWYGLVNVERGGPTAAALTGAGLVGRHIIDRFATDLRGVADLDGFLARLGERPRANLRRTARRAAESGLTTTVGPATGADLTEIAELCGRTAARFGNAGFYPADTFVRFVRTLGPAAHVLQIRQRDRLVAAGVCLTDELRFHTWTCGVDYEVTGNASPYAVLYIESVRLAIALGRPVLEGGRSNEAFKRRHGLTARRLDAYLARA